MFHNFKQFSLFALKENVGYQGMISQNTLASGPKVIKVFSCSTQQSTKFQLLIKIKIPTNKEVACFMSLRVCIYHADKC